MLYVEGKLENGYHSLKMLNAKVSLADELEFTLNNVNAVEYSIDELNHLENNLCLNVLNELTSLFNIKEHYHIYIRDSLHFKQRLVSANLMQIPWFWKTDDRQCLVLIFFQLRVGRMRSVRR